MILAATSIMNPDYVPTEWQTYLLTVFILVTHAIISSMPTLFIARFNSIGTMINIACLLIVIIIIPAAAINDPKFQSNEFAWGIQNFTDWPDGVAILMSFLAIIWTMSGKQGSLHRSGGKISWSS
jgi:amino acid transporter